MDAALGLSLLLFGQDFDFGIKWDDYDKHFRSHTGPVMDDLAKAGFESKPRKSHESDFYLYHPAGLCGLDVEFWPWFPCGEVIHHHMRVTM